MSTKFEKIINQKIKENQEKKKEEEERKEEEKSKSEKVQTMSFSNSKSTNETKNLTANEAIEKAREIETNYKSGNYLDAPSSLNLERISVPEMTEEEISNKAKNEVSDKYSSSKEKSNQSFQNKIDEVIESNKNLYLTNQENQEKINSYYDSSKKETENQALKRGLARSSIIIGELATIEGSRANELSKLLESFQTTLNQNQEKIQTYQTQKEQAIEELNIKEALEIEEKISALTEEYEKAKKDAIEFNNNIEKIEAEYKLDYEKQKLQTKQDALKLDKTYNKNYIENEMKQKQYDYLESYLDSLEPSEALNILLTNKEFKSILQENYSKLYRHIANKV